MTRDDVLVKAARIVGTNGHDYAPPEKNFERIAAIANVVLGDKLKSDCPVSSTDIALLMIAVKIARLVADPQHHDGDGWVDIAGYAACGGEVAA
jgi:hypothetical protein